MKLRSAVKTALALVLSATIAFGMIGGVTPVKSMAAPVIAHVNLTVNIGSTGNFDVDMGTDATGCRQPDSEWDAAWMTENIHSVGTSYHATLTFSPTASVVPKTYTIRYAYDYDNDTDTDVTYIHVIVKNSTNTDKPDNGEDPILGTLPPTGPDGHQHSWEWVSGSTYHCPICNTYYTAFPAHEHQYEWYVTKPATETDDGEAQHMCKICGAVDMKEPVGAYYLFSQNTENKINKAPVGGTVNVETYRWLSFQGYVLDALAKRPDVTLNVTFRENGYKGGEVKTVTIPAGYDAASLKDANGYCGFKYLAGVFGAN